MSNARHPSRFCFIEHVTPFVKIILKKILTKLKLLVYSLNTTNNINSIEKCAMFIKQNKYKYIVQFEGDCAYFSKYITLLRASTIIKVSKQ